MSVCVRLLRTRLCACLCDARACSCSSLPTQQQRGSSRSPAHLQLKIGLLKVLERVVDAEAMRMMLVHTFEAGLVSETWRYVAVSEVP
jgi:hypothetical protein